MKSYALCLALFLSIHQNSIGEILNGYLYKKYALQNELIQSTYLLAKSTSKKQKKLITNKLKRLEKKLKLIEEKFLETEQLLNEIRSIDLELFYKVSNLKNAEGTTTNVYVRYTQLTEKESLTFMEHFPRCRHL